MRDLDPSLPRIPTPIFPWVATLLFWGAVACFGAGLFGTGLAEFSQARQPVALLGARGVPHALAFNVSGLVLPGALLAVVAWRLRAALPEPASWLARIGAWLVLWSALAFALQGLLPLQADDLDAAASRLHATAWTLWWLAFVPGAVLLGLGLRRDRRLVPMVACLAGAGLVAGLALAPSGVLAPGIAERLAYAAWFGWWVFAARWVAGWAAGRTAG